MNDTALLIIDTQLAMFELPGYELYGKVQVLDNIKALISRARAARVPVIYVQHGEEEGPLQTGSPGWAIHPAIAPHSTEVVVGKTTPDSFHLTTLEQTLKQAGIRRLVIAGMQTDFCVDTTCRRAFSLGYEVVLASDAHSTFDNEVLSAKDIIAHHNVTLKSGFARVVPTGDLRFEA